MGNSQQKPIKSPENPEDEEEEFTCEICIEPTSANNKFKNSNLCKHPFCQDCIAKCIEMKVVQDSTAEIKCPEPSCQHHLEPLAFRHITSPALFSTWCRLLCENSILGYEKSYCPNRLCRELVVNECSSSSSRRKIVKKCKRPNCKQLFCFQCQTVWHAGYRCEECAELRDRNDVLFVQLVEVEKWTRCPACGQCVERLQGCPVVTCRCKTIFCYECGKKMTISSGCGCKLGLLNVVHLYLPYFVGIVAILGIVIFEVLVIALYHPKPSKPS